MNTKTKRLVTIAILVPLEAFFLIGLPILLTPTTLNNNVDVIQHLGYDVQIQGSILHGQTLTYNSIANGHSDSSDQFNQWVGMLQSIKPQHVFYVLGKPGPVWDTHYPALFFVDDKGIIYLYQ
jgi:hypothetical protein